MQGKEGPQREIYCKRANHVGDSQKGGPHSPNSNETFGDGKIKKREKQKNFVYFLEGIGNTTVALNITSTNAKEKDSGRTYESQVQVKGWVENVQNRCLVKSQATQGGRPCQKQDIEEEEQERQRKVMGDR